MSKLIVQEFVTADGLAAGSDGNTDFIPASMEGDEAFGQRQLDFMEEVGAILLGAKTYKMFAGYWPSVPADAEDKPFADKINATPKIVVSGTLQRAPWGKFAEAAIVRTDPVTEARRLKDEHRGDIVIWGSISLAQSLMAAGVVDEIQLIVCPTLLGDGRRLFDKRAGSFTLELSDSRSFDRGAVLTAYEVATRASPASRPELARSAR